MADRTRELRDNRPEWRDALLWFAILAGPIAWITAELGSYSLAPSACWTGESLVLHLVALLTLCVAMAGALLARARLRRDAADPGGADEKRSRRRFMALAGIWSCVGFAVVILATEVPNLVLRVCD